MRFGKQNHARRVVGTCARSPRWSFRCLEAAVSGIEIYDEPGGGFEVRLKGETGRLRPERRRPWLRRPRPESAPRKSHQHMTSCANDAASARIPRSGWRATSTPRRSSGWIRGPRSW